MTIDWGKRFADLENERTKSVKGKVDTLINEYDESISTIEREIGAFFLRYAKKDKITYAEAKRMLTSSELKSFKFVLQKFIAQANDPKWKKVLEQLNARYRISRLEMLLVILQNEVERLAYLQEETVKSTAKEDYTEQYYHSLFLLQLGLGVGGKVEPVSEHTIEKLLKKDWAVDGLTFNERIKSVSEKLKKELETTLIQGFTRNDHPQKIVDTIVKKFKITRSNAERLVMTEHAYFCSSATRDSFESLGVEKYEILATLDLRTSEICRSMDGKVFPLSEYRIGVTAHPFHPRCRTTEIPYFEDLKEGQRIARDKYGKNILVPRTMKYSEWHEKFVGK